ncbi:MAG: FAD-dependent thymidylate synthase, partial [Candidatus Eisenbacteria bacterium]|nr:FAD-dependent thymidylate synthase [Candidatus Eisenbacteria bacterium]
MLITLAGATVPRLAQGAASTPEIVCAAYARISRSSRPVHELRARAAEDLAGARAFIERIVHHLGHESVAEHAVFNLDLIGVSRLVTEIVEHSRLASYTERSQRYVRIGGDFLIPREARESGFSAAFRSLARDQHALYRTAAARMAGSGDSRAGKEDARYALGLATTTQLGLTVNARALASMLERLDGDALCESRMLAGRIRTLVSKIAPSLVTEMREEADVARADCGSVGHPWPGLGSDEPTLLWHTPDPARVLRETRAFCAAPTDGRALIYGVSGQEWNRSLPRAFEAVQLAFHLVMSAAAFAQLKRHRMA